MKKRKKRPESEYAKLARLIKEEGDDTREYVDERIGAEAEGLRKGIAKMEERINRKMDEGFTAIIRRLDSIIQMQLDEHARRIKKLETAVFSR